MTAKRVLIFASLAALLQIAMGNSSFAQSTTSQISADFNRDVRPILADACFTCHGPDPVRRKAKLRLDTREGLLGAKPGAGVVVPGKPEESDLVDRIESKDAETMMPPPESGKSLNSAQIATLKRWVDQGANWKGHWAYLTPTRVEVPATAGQPSHTNEIDLFLMSKLNERGLKPAIEADRATLVRRLSFDLRGLPPSPAEVSDFVKDTRPNAYESLVDKFLGSPQFGERMAMYWLDLVRYADTNGYHSDNHRDVYLYRDYVIDAFNKNVPFDRFTTEQLAGDLLTDATDETRIASGYNRLILTTEEGGGQAKEYLAKYAADRVRNVGSVWLGGTIGCAECHDHKYDPYTTRDFYSMAAFFSDIKETAVGKQEPTAIPRHEQKVKLAELDAKLVGLQKTLDDQTPDLDRALAEWEAKLSARKSSVLWNSVKPIKASSKNGATLSIAVDGTILVSGKQPDRDVYDIEFRAGLANVTGLRLDVLPDASLPMQGPGRAQNGNLVLNGIEAKTEGRSVAFGFASASHSQENWSVTGAIDLNSASGWAILPQTGKSNHAVLELKEDLTGDTIIRLKMRFEYGTKHTLGKFRLSTTDAVRPVRADGQDSPPPAIVSILALSRDKRTETQKRELSAYFRSITPLLDETRRAIADTTRERDSIRKASPTTLITSTMAPRTMRILPRGNWLDDSGAEVLPAFPAFLTGGSVPKSRLTRLDLARWLTSAENPLVARVFVNRLWKLAFGQGLVSSLDDFGSQGSWPSHPELLDWLANDFRERGWNVKATLKRMLMSNAYRATSIPSETQKRIDPANVWLSRQNRYRLDAEIVRDNALAISGLLVTKFGGPSTKPYQPAGYWAMMNFPKREWQNDQGEGLYRRGLYTYWCRTFLHPSLLAFDASTREECRVDRPRSNTPLQALVLLNDPSYVEAARAFGERILREGGRDTVDRLRFAIIVALAREPRTEELSLLRELQAKHRRTYESDRTAATELMRVGDRPVPADLDPAELAAWTSVARVILNLHETISRN